MSRCWACLFLGALACGCAWKGGPIDDEADIRGTSRTGVWQLAPFEMRVYPSTRFVRADDASVLDARIELLDEMGDSVKGVGRFRLELYADDQEGSEGGGIKLYGWQVSTLSLNDQRLYYDSITRSYLFRLKLEDNKTSRRNSVLKVIFISADGTRLSTRSALPLGLGRE